MTCTVNMGKLLQLSGASSKAISDGREAFTDSLHYSQAALGDAYGPIRAQSFGMTELQLIDSWTGFSENVIADLESRMPEVPSLEPAAVQHLRAYTGKINQIQGAIDDLKAIQQVLDTPTRPDAAVEDTLQKMADLSKKFEPLFGHAADYASNVPVAGLIASASLNAMGEAYKVFMDPIREQMIKAAVDLANLRNERTEDGESRYAAAFDGLPPAGTPERAECLRKMIAAIDGYTEVDTDLGAPEITDVFIDTTTLDAVGNFLKMLHDAFDPLVIDLDGDGVELTALDDPTVYFDFENVGAAFNSGWVAADDGIVVRDLFNDGVITSGDEFFGNADTDALEDLLTYDDNGDGVIDFQDAVWSEMRVWQDLNSNGETDAGEMRTMAEAGVASIRAVALERAGDANSVLVGGGAPVPQFGREDEGLFTSEGNTIAATSVFTRTDGSTGESWAVFLDVTPADSVVDLPDGFVYDEAVFELPDLRGGGYIGDLWVAMSQDSGLRDAVEFLADNINTLDHIETRALFEEIIFGWIGGRAGLDTSQSKAETLDDRKLIVETYFASQPEYPNHNGHDDYWLLTTDVRIDFGYESLVEAMLLRFATQVTSRDLRLAADDAAHEAALASPMALFENVIYDFTENSISTTPFFLMKKLGQLTPDNRGEAFDFLDKAMPILRGMRVDLFQKDPVNWTVPDDGGNYEQFLFENLFETNDQNTAIDGPLKDPVLAEYAYYRGLAETGFQGTTGDDVFTPEKGKYVNALGRTIVVASDGTWVDDGVGRDFTFMDGGLGDDVLISRPWIGLQDPLELDDTNNISEVGRQNTTIIRYRQGDGDDTIDMSQASGRHIVFLEDIDSTQASLTIDPASPGSFVLSFAGGGSIRFDRAISGDNTNPDFANMTEAEQAADLRELFTELHGIIDHDIEFRFADNESVDWQDVFSQSSDGDDFILGRVFGEGDTFAHTPWHGTSQVSLAQATFQDDFLGGGLGDDYLNGRTGNDTYVYNQGDGVDVIADQVDYIRGTDGNIYPDVNVLRIQGHSVDDAVFTRGNALVAVRDADGVLLYWAASATGDEVLSVADHDRVRPSSADLVVSFVDGAGAHVPGQAIIVAGHFSNHFGKPEGAIADFIFDDASFQMNANGLTSIDRSAGLGEAQILFVQNGDGTVSGGIGDDLYVRHGAVSGDATIADGGAVTDTDILRIEAVDPYQIGFVANGDDVIVTLPNQLGSITLKGQLGASGAEAMSAVQVVFPRGGDDSQGFYDYVDPDNHIGNGLFSHYVTDGPYTYDYDLNLYRFTATDIAARLTPVSGTEATLSDALGDITGTSADETLLGGATDQVLSGGGGSDAYVFGVGGGNDIIRESGDLANRSVDRLELTGLLPEHGIHASDVRFTRTGDFDLLLTIEATGETLLIEDQFASNGNAIEYIIWGDGTVWRPEIIAERSTWEGTGGADIVIGTDGRDRIDGNPGDDQLEGRDGADIYVFREGDGQDTIIDPSPDNVIDLGDVPVATLRAAQVAGSDDVLLSYGTLGDTILLVNQAAADPTLHPVATILTGTSAPLTVGDLLAINHVTGGTGDEELIGTAGIDVMDGRGGDDTLWGAQGTDRYIVRAGDGEDLIVDYGFDTPDNRLEMEGLNQADVRIFREPGAQDLLIEILSTGEIITIQDQFAEHYRGSGSDRYYGVAEIAFADGSTLGREAIGDIAAISGTPGDDILTGGRGDDTYRWGAGQGNDTIVEMGRRTDFDKLILDGLNRDDVTFMRFGPDDSFANLYIQINATGETLTLQGQMGLFFGEDEIDEIEFADGTRLDLPAFQYSLDYHGTASDDEIDDYLVFGGAMVGEQGDDILRGSLKYNTYRWSPGDGNDTIAESEETYPFDEETGEEFPPIEVPIAGEGDVLELIGVSGSQVGFTRSPSNIDDLLVTITTPSGGTEVITVLAQFTGPLYGLELIRTDDQTFTAGDIIAAAGGLDLPGTGSPDLLTGGIGPDQFTPGGGDDTIETGGGRDLIVIEDGGGIDTVDGFRPGPIGTRVSLPASAFADFAAVLAAATQVASDVEIDLGGGNLLMLLNVQIGDLTVENFGFARPEIVGTPEADRLVGTYLDDRMRGLDGADNLMGRGGDDVLRGEAGADALSGGQGDDALFGGGERDLLDGGAGNDVIDGGEGDDVIAFSAGTDTVDGGDGLDQMQMAGNLAEYDVSIGAADPSGTPSVTVTELATGAVTSANSIERLIFADQEIAVINEAPVAQPIPAADLLIDAVLEAGGSALDMSAYFNDADGDFLLFSATGLPDGLAINPANGLITGVLTAPAGEYLASVAVTDGFSAPVAQVLAITVEVPASLEALDDLVVTDEDTAATFDVRANDLSRGGLSLSVTGVAQGAFGAVAIGDDGLLTYTPDADFSGSDSFTYTVEGGGLSASAVVDVTVTPVNDAPQAVALVTLTTRADTPLVDVAIGATDVDGDTLSYALQSAATMGGVTFDAPAGTFTYAPGEGAGGDEAFTIEIRDGQGGLAAQLVQIEVEPLVGAGVDAQDDAGFRVDTYDTLAIGVSDLLANDTGSDLQIAALGAPDHGSVRFSADGRQILFTSGPTFEGTATFAYTVTDGAQSDTASVSVEVEQVYGYVAEASGRGRYLSADRNEDSLLIGSKGRNVLLGRQGDDTLDGRGGADRLFGRRGDDRLHGDGGRDFLFAGSGDDRLEGGRGNDHLSGGRGSDVFVFSTGDGRDIIRDFDTGGHGGGSRGDSDRIQLDVAGIDSFQDVMDSARENRGGVTLDFGGGDRIKISGIGESDLAEDMFDLL